MKLRKYMNILISVMLIVIQGCAGIVVISTDEVSIANPIIGDTKGKLSDKEVMRQEILSQHSSFRYILSDYEYLLDPEYTYTADTLLKYWGSPDSVYMNDGIEVWEYDFGYYFKGIIIAVVIPIPLGWPFCSEKISFSIEQNRITSVYAKKGSQSFAWLVGLVPKEREVKLGVAYQRRKKFSVNEAPSGMQMGPGYIIKELPCDNND